MGIVAILVMWPGPLKKLSFPHPIEALYEIWLQSARQFQKRRTNFNIEILMTLDQGQRPWPLILM